MDGFQYELELKSDKEEGKIYSFDSADGVVSKDSFRDSELIMADSVEPEKDDDILVLYPGYGFLGALFGDYAPEGKTVLASSSDRSYQVSKHNLDKNSVENASYVKVASPGEIGGEFDKILYAPKSYTPVKLVKNRLIEAFDLLKDRGEIFLGSSKKEGLNRYRKWLERFDGELERVGKRKSYQVYQLEKTGSSRPGRERVRKRFETEVEGEKAEFETAEGLFSPDQLDRGSRLLLENIEIEESDKVWDVGCGYGAIGIVLEKLYSCDIYLSDDDARAVKIALENLERNEIADYRIENADCLDCFSGEKFDIIVSNPPTHQGKGVTGEIFRRARKRLERNGKFFIVYNQNMEYENKLEEIFEKVEIEESEDNFCVIKAVK